MYACFASDIKECHYHLEDFLKCKVIRKVSRLLLEANMTTVIMSLSFSRLHDCRFVLVFIIFG